MFALLAIVLGCVLVYAMWRLMDPSRANGGTDRPTPAPRPTRPKPVRRQMLPPDDNPDFLRELDRRLPARGSSDEPTDPPKDGDKGEDGPVPA